MAERVDRSGEIARGRGPICRRCGQPIVLQPSGSWAHPNPLSPGWFPHYPAPRSGESGIVVPATAVGHSRLIRRPRGAGETNAAADITGWAPGEITEVFGK